MEKTIMIFKPRKRQMPIEQFYGAPNRIVYVISKKAYIKPSHKPEFEFFIELLKELSYDYKKRVLFEQIDNEERPVIPPLTYDKFDKKRELVLHCHDCKTYLDAEAILNSLVQSVATVRNEPTN